MLGQSKDPRAVEALLPDLQDADWKVRRNAAQALGALKSPAAVEGLLAALKDRTATVRERAAVALGRIKDPRTIPALVAAVIEEKDAAHFHVNEGAYQAVRKFGRKAGPALAEALTVKQNMYLVELLADSKYEVPADFFFALAENSDPSMRRTAIQALGKSKDPRVVEYLVNMLSGADIEAQILAVQALGQLHAEQAAPQLLALLRDDSSQGDPLHGPRAGLYRAITDAFQEFSGIKKAIANAFPVNSKLSFGVSGATTSLAEMMGMLGEEGFQKLNQMLTDAESRASKLSDELNVPPEIVQAVSAQTWKFGAMFADGRDAKNEQVRLLMDLLKSDSPMTRTAVALSLPWYRDIGVLETLGLAMQDADDMVRGGARWAFAALQNMFPHHS
jgi:HEAT repeat protein